MGMPLKDSDLVSNTVYTMPSITVWVLALHHFYHQRIPFSGYITEVLTTFGGYGNNSTEPTSFLQVGMEQYQDLTKLGPCLTLSTRETSVTPMQPLETETLKNPPCVEF